MNRPDLRNVEMFDELLTVLSNRKDEKGAGQLRDDLNAARVNYVHKSLDYLAKSLILVLHDVLRNPPDEPLRTELYAAIDRGFKQVFDSTRMRELAQEYVASGQPLLSEDQILEEVARRRGSLR
jgi:hypothetical protein